MMQIVGSFAEFERAMLRERTKTGLNAARLFRGHPAAVA
jgi:DNA invertase Pin-like site-specific DNA recombinase